MCNGSKVEDAPSHHRLLSMGTLETVVIRCGEGSWPESDSGMFSAERQWCTGCWLLAVLTFWNTLTLLRSFMMIIVPG